MSFNFFAHPSVNELDSGSQERQPAPPEPSSEIQHIISPAAGQPHTQPQPAHTRYFISQHHQSVAAPNFLHPRPQEKRSRDHPGEDWAMTNTHDLFNEDEESEVADSLSSFRDIHRSQEPSRPSPYLPSPYALQRLSSSSSDAKLRFVEPPRLRQELHDAKSEVGYLQTKALNQRSKSQIKLARLSDDLKKEHEASQAVRDQLHQAEVEIQSLRASITQVEESAEGHIRKIMMEHERKLKAASIEASIEASAAAEKRLNLRLEKLESENESRNVAQGIRHAKATPLPLSPVTPNPECSGSNRPPPHIFSRSAWKSKMNTQQSRHHILISTASIQPPSPRPPPRPEPGSSTTRVLFDVPPSPASSYRSSTPVTPSPPSQLLTREDLKNELRGFAEAIVSALHQHQASPSGRSHSRRGTPSRRPSSSRKYSDVEGEAGTDGDDELYGDQDGGDNGLVEDARSKRVPYDHNPYNPLVRHLYFQMFHIKNDADIHCYRPVMHTDLAKQPPPFDEGNPVFDLTGTASSAWNCQVIEIVYQRGLLLQTHPKYHTLKKSQKLLRASIVGKYTRLRKLWLKGMAQMKEDGTVETPEEVEARMKEEYFRKLKYTRHYQRRKDRYNRRLELVLHQISTAGQNNPSMATWEWLRELIQKLGLDGMSSDESDVNTGSTRSEVVIKKLPWRRDYNEWLDIVDGLRGEPDDGYGDQGLAPLPRVRYPMPTFRTDAPLVTDEKRIVHGLPINMYDKVWRSSKSPRYLKDVIHMKQSQFREVELLSNPTS